MIIVTGGAGFIGSNLIMGLNKAGYDDILAVDNLHNGRKFSNLTDCQIADYLDKDEFITQLLNGDFDQVQIEAVLHQGACSATTEWDGKYMMENNYSYSKHLLHFCQRRKIPFIYASSAAVYGAGKHFEEIAACEKPLNVYGYSKLQFDNYVRRRFDISDTTVVGLRYFNVYGPREGHKGSMASVAFHLNNQMHDRGEIALFEGCDGMGDGEQLRDFVYVEDVVAVNLWLLEQPLIKGIFNVGTGKAQPFNDVAKAVLDFHKKGSLKYIPFPQHLLGCYQSFTEADLTNLRSAGCEHQFLSVDEGVAKYMEWLNQS